MYISGVPGTGKTTTLYEVKRTLEANRRHLPAFKWVEINGVRLGDPKQFYPQLHMVNMIPGSSFKSPLNISSSSSSSFSSSSSRNSPGKSAPSLRR